MPRSALAGLGYSSPEGMSSYGEIAPGGFGRWRRAHVMARITLSGKLTELVGSRHSAEKAQFMIQVSLVREPLGKVPIADRYYCCGFYITQEEATAFRSGQPIKITIEQD